MPKTYGGMVTICKPLLDITPLTFTDLDGKVGTIDDIVLDGLRGMLGLPPLFRWPPPPPPEPPITSIIREGCCTDWPKPCSYHEGWLDGYECRRYDEDND